MCKLEKRLLRVGGNLVRINRHRIYELNGVRYTFSHSKKGENRDRMKHLQSVLTKLESKQ